MRKEAKTGILLLNRDKICVISIFSIYLNQNINIVSLKYMMISRIIVSNVYINQGVIRQYMRVPAYTHRINSHLE